jgi:hypothetical protein
VATRAAAAVARAARAGCSARIRSPCNLCQARSRQRSSRHRRRRRCRRWRSSDCRRMRWSKCSPVFAVRVVHAAVQPRSNRPLVHVACQTNEISKISQLWLPLHVDDLPDFLDRL